MIFAIDPGNIESAYTEIDNVTLKPIDFKKVDNWELLNILGAREEWHPWDKVAIEMVAHYGTGMPAGKDVFDTCVWIGRYLQFLEGRERGPEVKLIYRKDEKMNLCGSMKAKDGNIIQALVDRFAPGVPNKGKGIVNKKVNQPGWFHGFADDVWQAYAVGVTYHDLYLKG